MKKHNLFIVTIIIMLCIPVSCIKANVKAEEMSNLEGTWYVTRECDDIYYSGMYEMGIMQNLAGTWDMVLDAEKQHHVTFIELNHVLSFDKDRTYYIATVSRDNLYMQGVWYTDDASGTWHANKF